VGDRQVEPGEEEVEPRRYVPRGWANCRTRRRTCSKSRYAGYFNDLLAGDVTATIPTVDPGTGEVLEVEKWALNDVCDEEYNRHLSNMIKERVRRGSGAARGFVERWRPRTGGARVDYRACEVYQLAMAHGPGQCFALPGAEMLARQHAPQPPAKTGGITTPDGRKFFATQR
jgi:hypothetical protein